MLCVYQECPCINGRKTVTTIFSSRYTMSCASVTYKYFMRVPHRTSPFLLSQYDVHMGLIRSREDYLLSTYIRSWVNWSIHLRNPMFDQSYRGSILTTKNAQWQPHFNIHIKPLWSTVCENCCTNGVRLGGHLRLHSVALIMDVKDDIVTQARGKALGESLDCYRVLAWWL